MATSDANVSALAFAEETTYGVLPASPDFKLLRMTGESLAHVKETIQSQEIRSDRQVPDLALVGSSATGGVNFELSFLEYQTFFQALLCGTTTEYDFSATSGDIATAGQTFTATTPGDLAGIPIGGFIRIAGATTAGNNGYKRILTNTGTIATFGPGSFTANESGVSLDLYTKSLRNGSTRRSFCFERQVTNSLEAKAYQTYPGCYVGDCAIKVESKSIITGTFNVLGKFGVTGATSLNTNLLTAATAIITASGQPGDTETVTINGKVYTFQVSLTNFNGNVLIGGSASATLDNLIAAINLAAGAGTTYATATTLHPTVSALAGAGDTIDLTAKTGGTAGNALTLADTAANITVSGATFSGGVAHAYLASHDGDILNGTSNMGTIQGTAGTYSEKLRLINFTVNNMLRGKDALAELGNFEVGLGTFDVKGNISAYFADNTLYQALIAHDNNSIGFTLQDSAGNVIAFTFPRIKWGTGNPNASAINTDIMLDIDFTAIRDPSTGVTMIVDFFPA